MKRFTSLLGILFICLMLSDVNFAQISNNFQLANRFMQQQNYEKALPLFKKLVSENPTEYFFFERYMQCYIELKQYDQALDAYEELNPSIKLGPQAKVIKAQLFYFKEDTAQAFTIWNSNIDENPKNLQIYINTANVLSNMKEFDKSVAILREARVVFQNSQLFFNEISTTLLQAGNYEGAVQEWISWLTVQPDQISNIQRLLLRFNDPFLNDITILELEDALQKMAVSNPAYSSLFRFQVWLLQENKLYRRALASAKAFEESTNNFNYSLFQLGRSLRANKEFELAEQAFSYYIEKAQGNVKWQSRQELATVYSEWAKQLDDYNIGVHQQKDSLYKKSLTQLNTILGETSSYRNINKVLLMKSEIVLDHLHDLQQANEVLAILNNLSKDTETAEEFYIEGRIHIANKKYREARIALTKSNKLAELGELAEKTRYFLALTDFFSGDFEFATIQLKTLGRQNTSYYANDALELRLWIQEGLNADSTGALLEPFAKAVFESITGDYMASKEILLEMINSDPNSPLYDELLVLISENPTVDISKSLDLYIAHLNSNAISSNKERLMWERAKYADLTIKRMKVDKEYQPMNEISVSTVTQYYEELILEYPQGFYAPYARTRLKELTSNNI